MANVDTGNLAVWLSESTTHTGLQSIGTSATQHLVDADDMVRVGADTQVEGFLAGNLGQVLVGADTGGFESLRRDLFVLVGDEVDAGGEIVYTGLLSSKLLEFGFVGICTRV